MRVCRRLVASLLWWALALTLAGVATFAFGQASYTAQVRGVVKDQSGAMITDATVTISNDATGISNTAHSDANGLYVLTGLRPAVYTIKADKPGFRAAEQKNVVLQVDQQTTIDFELHPLGVSTTVEVTEAAPLLDTENAAIGTDVTNEYVRDIPLYGRNPFGLVFLAGGVTETTGSDLGYPAGTNFVSNGQRNATAQITLDGSPLSAPEQGEGGNSNVYYQPSVEIVQEFKVQNNSFSAEFGNNGGTIVNMVLKQGGNAFHGSGWWYGQRSNFDARDFFNTGEKPDHLRDQYGFSLGGPIIKNKTFFFVDFEKIRQQDPINLSGIVPTDLERTGDFSQSPANLPKDPADDPDGLSLSAGIYDPCAGNPQGPDTPCAHEQFPGNVIPSVKIDSIGQALLNLYPHPNIPDAVYPDHNWRKVIIGSDPGWQFDVKVDHQFTSKHRIAGRYSRHHDEFTAPTVIGSDQGDGAIYLTNVQNGGLEYNWSVTPTALWTSRFSVDRVHAPGISNNYPTLSSVGLSPDLAANGLDRMITIGVDDPFLSLFTQCCVDTHFAHTLYSYSSELQWVKGRHSIKIGGEQRLFYNNFWQPDNPTGIFNFSRDVTTSQPNNGLGDDDHRQGNPFATILLGYPHDASLHLVPAVADKSKETAFYVQDDWKVSPKLSVNLGLRYEWSTPYSERYDRLQFNDFTGNTGISIPYDRDGTGMFPQFGQIGPIMGTSVFPTSGHRNSPVDRNNFAPRLGFAYQLANNTVVRGGVGVFYGMNVATNFQYAGPAFAKTAQMYFSKDNFNTQFACLGPSNIQTSCSSPFPGGLAPPQGTKYGDMAQWGFGNSSDLDTSTARNAEIYQWNLGIQHLLPGQIVIGVDYSASHSTHLPWAGAGGISTRNRNFLPSQIRSALVAALNPTHDPASTAVTDYLNTEVPNPFQCFFTTGAAVTGSWCPSSPTFSAADVADSRYMDDTIPQQLLLEPYPQFDGGFEGLPTLNANSWYHSLQIRFQKRASHYISFEGNYTFSKATDDSSAGRNAWLGNLWLDNPQLLDNLKEEHAISANDTPQRLTAAIIIDLPFGKDRWIGRGMNSVLDAIVGGWALNSVITLQSGQPIALYNAAGLLVDGNQRPNVICPQISTGLSYRDAAITGGSVINQDCFGDPGDNMPGNAPRYFSNLRGDGIHNLDTSLSKEFQIRENQVLQVRAEMFNAFNHQRFAFPDVGSGDGALGQVTSTTNNFRRMQFGARYQF
ncbi:MAG TPA: carboxypeptidase regulatory-like domain-containing protein [Candidatus Sulfotelmatobacter sp.]|nr:carboxypeptidase regulatory-like domain-containing protein [Candidatus Sulfotelmatobacter sp.]